MCWQDDGDMGEEVEEDASLYDCKCQRTKERLLPKGSSQPLTLNRKLGWRTFAGKLHGVPFHRGLFFCRVGINCKSLLLFGRENKIGIVLSKEVKTGMKRISQFQRLIGDLLNAQSTFYNTEFNAPRKEFSSLQTFYNKIMNMSYLMC